MAGCATVDGSLVAVLVVRRLSSAQLVAFLVLVRVLDFVVLFRSDSSIWSSAADAAANDSCSS